MEWPPPDQNGIRTLEKIGARSTLGGRRIRRADQHDPKQVALWPERWRELLRKWVRGTSCRRQWRTLLQEAGNHDVPIAFELQAALLRGGWIQVEESRTRGVWNLLAVEFLHLEELREALGLANRNALRQAQAVLTGDFRTDALRQAFVSLAGQPPERAIRRHQLLGALDTWIQEQRAGTRRDFALFARGDTKGISSGDWSWLAEVVDLEAQGVSQHVSVMWFKAPLELTFATGSMDLRPLQNILALPPGALLEVTGIQGKLSCWRVLENRTSFERVAAGAGVDEGVIWVPGFAPSWWLEAVGHLIDLCPAPLLLACDPDPAGVMIASIVARVWSERYLSWRPWGMSPEALASLPRQKPLSDYDRQLIEDLLRDTTLHPEFRALFEWMRESNVKGEQEGIAL